MSVDWSTYANAYDGLARNSPPYKELVQVFETTFRELELPDGARIADMGCGTGNFTLAIARACPRAVLSAYDNNERMLEILRAKAARAGVSIQSRIADLRTQPEAPQSLDAISYVHCLYVLQKQGALSALAQGRSMLKQGGYLVVADIGRELVPAEFARVGGKHMLEQYSILEFLREIFRMRGVQKEAKRIQRYQREGRFYMHTHEELRAEIQNLGFEIQFTRGNLYLGITDFIVARKPRG
jgi:ubiquinone/menaquinone biosynthesis C-methylase UbiE